jgi:hypothetical protein
MTRQARQILSESRQDPGVDRGRNGLSALITGGLIFLLSMGAAWGTTYEMIADEELARQAAVIIQAVVVAREPAPIPSPPSTDYFVQVERVLKGFVAGSTVIVRLAGGIGPDGVGLRVWGSPQFQQGERVLLFLVPRADGTYGVLHLMLGVFHEVQFGGRRLAVRDLSEARQALSERDLLSQGPVGLQDPPRRWDAFARWLTELGPEAAQSTPQIDKARYMDVESADAFHEQAPHSALLLEPCTGLGLRWFGFNRRRPVTWHMNSGSAEGNPKPSDLSVALDVWELATAGRLQLSMAGSTTSSSGLSEHDGLNTVLFDDPDDWITGSYRCQAGGVLAVSGLWFDSGRDQQCRLSRVGRTGSAGERVYLRISSADIVTNDGAGCYFAGDRSRLLEVLTHEIGHTLGLTHANEAEAVMFGPVHDDGRGATLEAWDQNSIKQIYGPGSN